MPGGLLDMFGIDPVANRQRRDRTAELDKTIAGELARVRLANQGQLDVEGLRGKNDIANTQTRGNEDRKTQSSLGEINKALEVLRSANIITEAEHKQRLEYASKLDIPYSKENVETADRALTDTRIKKSLQQDAQTIAARSAPGFQESLNAGLQAGNLTPAFNNMRTGAMSVGPGDMLMAPPSGAALPPADLNQWNQAQGATSSEVINMVGGIPNPVTGEMQFQTPEVTRVQKPGQVRISPQIQQRALQLQEPTPPPQVNTQPPALDPIVQMMLRLRQGQQSTNNGIQLPF